jgi:predicted dienelactone hydrolase
MQRRHLIATGALWPLAAAPAAAQTATEAEWFDAARSRRVPLLMRWPAGSGPCALILHSHGLGGSRDGGDAWGRAWQAAGFAVLHLQHAGSDTEALRGGLAALRSAASAEQLRARVADLRFAIDEIERRVRAGEAPFARVRPDALGASGHSFGAQTVQALAGKRFPVATPEFFEPRLKALIALSPSLGRGDRASPQEQFGSVQRPLLVATGSHDGDPLGSGMTGADRARVYDGLPVGRRALLWVDGADHVTFGGNARQRITARRGLLRRADGAQDAEPLHQERIAAVTTLWWRAHLLGDASARAALARPPGLGPEDRWQMD